MDEFNRGMDPAVKKYFGKIMSSFAAGLSWLVFFALTGIYFQLAIIQDKLRWYNIVFYLLFIVTLFWLIRYFHKTWNSASHIMSDEP
jgi:hypothetical protein